MSTEIQNTSNPQQIDTRERENERLPVVSPRVDIFENDDELLLVAEVPGAGPEDLSIQLERRVLFIEATGSFESGNAEMVACEFAPVRYRRAFALKTGIDAEKIRAELKDGLLKVHLPRAEAEKPRKIKVVEA